MLIANFVDQYGNENEIQSSFFTIEPRFDTAILAHTSILATIGQTR